MIQLFVILVVLGASLPSIHGNDQPIEPDNYAKMIKQGFATNYFKVLPPARRYNPQNIEDVYNMGFRNLRLRSRADLYTAPYNTDPTFKTFLQKLEDVSSNFLYMLFTANVHMTFSGYYFPYILLLENLWKWSSQFKYILIANRISHTYAQFNRCGSSKY